MSSPSQTLLSPDKAGRDLRSSKHDKDKGVNVQVILPLQVSGPNSKQKGLFDQPEGCDCTIFGYIQTAAGNDIQWKEAERRRTENFEVVLVFCKSLKYLKRRLLSTI